MNEPSQLYLRCLEEAKRHHASSKTYSGLFLRPHAPFIKELIREFDIKSILDYGAGKGEQYKWVMPLHGTTLEEYWGREVTKYDPAWPPFATAPSGKFDLVLCTHTLATIPVADMDWVMDRLYGYAGKVIYVAEKIGMPKKSVFSEPGLMPHGWSPEQWSRAIERDTDVKVILSVHEKDQEQQLRHIELDKPGSWWRYEFPAGVRAMDASWA
jgi:hypothetical protein